MSRNQAHDSGSRLEKLASDVRHVKFALENHKEAEFCLQQLFITDPTSDRNGIITAKGQRTPGTCEWITSKQPYETWAASQAGLLWISGPPGNGKTFLAIFLTQILEKLKPDATVIFFFCDNNSASRRTAVNILRGMMYQLVQRHPHLISRVLPTWRVQQDGLFRDHSFEALWGVFEDMIDALAGQEICCVLDALDECDEASLSPLLSKLKGLFDVDATPPSRNHRLKLVVLSRERPLCLPSALSAFPQVKVQEERDDIDRFISDRVAHLAKLKGIEGSPLHRHIRKVFSERSEGTFLWVSFMAQDLEAKTVDRIEASLDQLPRGLDAIYQRIVSQVKPGDKKECVDMLRWLTLANRPLTVREICEAIQIEPTQNLSRTQVCLGLIKSLAPLVQLSGELTLTQSEHEAEIKKVGFVHQSAKDYILERSLNAPGTMEDFSIDSKEGHIAIATRLIGCIRTGCLDDGRALFEKMLKYPLLEYATYHWHHHMEELGNDCAQVVKANRDFFKKASKIRARWWGWVVFNQEKACDVPLLHIACGLDLTFLVRHLLSKKINYFGLRQPKEVNQALYTGDRHDPDTPLQIACRCGDEKLVETLLEYGADVRLGLGDDKKCFTALHHAVAFQNHGIFRVLAATRSGMEIRREEARLESCPERESLLHLAAETGQEDLCHDLIENHHYNIDMTYDGDRTALCHAIERGHLALARALVERHGASTKRHWALLWAADHMNYKNDAHFEEAFRLLVDEWGVDIGATDSDGNTILHDPRRRGSSNSGHIGFNSSTHGLKVYLSHGGNPGQLNSKGETFLHLARKRDGVSLERLRLALQDGRLDINTQDELGATALHSLLLGCNFNDAAHYWVEYLKRLLDHGADRHLRTTGGQLACDFARQGYAQAQKDEEQDLLYNDARGQYDYVMDTPGNQLRFYEMAIDVLENYATVPFDVRAVACRNRQDSRG